MNTILVTGGAGYIGSHAVIALIEAGYRVVVLDNLTTGNREMVDPRVIFVEGDTGDEALVKRILQEYAITTVMHFAASIVVPESVQNPLKYYHNNTLKSLVLIRACIESGVKYFVFSSTAAVYGLPKELPVTEETLPNPLSPYGASKLMTERILQDVACAHPIKYIALRYFNVAGADPKGRVGQCSPNATHLIKVACEAALGQRPHLPVFGSDLPTKDGTGVRDFIHVSDLIDAHVLALKYLEQGGQSQILNCGYGHGFSVKEVAQGMEKVSGKKVLLKYEDPRPGDPPEVVSKADKIRKILNWTPKHNDLDFILKTAWEWECKRVQESI